MQSYSTFHSTRATQTLNPDNDTPLLDLHNHEWTPFSVNRLIVAYHRPVNLRNLLFTRCLKDVPGLEISTLLES